MSVVDILINSCTYHLGHCDSRQISVDRAFDVLRALISAGASLEDCQCDAARMEDEIWISEHFELHSEWFGILTRNGFNILDHVDLVEMLRIPNRPHLVQGLVSLGLAPNCNARNPDPWESPLFVCLWGALNWLGEYPLDSWEQKCIIDNLVALIELGANLYQFAPVDAAIHSKEIATAFPNTPIATPTVFAIAIGIEEEWKLALRRSGLDPAEVFAKDESYRRDCLHLHCAKSTAVQLEDDPVYEQGVKQRLRTYSASDD